MPEDARGGAVPAFTLIYLTFFLDNVLLTVLVPIIPDWVRGESLALWASQSSDIPLATMLNHTVRQVTHHDPQDTGWRAAGVSQGLVGLVLGAKAVAQLVTAPLAGAAVSRRGAAPVLRAATALLASAALGLAMCSAWRGRGAALCVCGARAAHGAGAALAGVAGLALAARALPAERRHAALGALLGAVALGVLVGYPFGGATNALWSRGAPFLFIAVALLIDLALQYIFLNNKEYNRGAAQASVSARAVVGAARRGAAGACAGCVALSTCVLAALEPCLPPWLERAFRPPPAPAQLGLVFVPDSLGYLLAASAAEPARRLGAERVAVAGQVCVGLSALCVPQARSLAGLAVPHLALGLGLGAADAALVPALMARAGRQAPALAALLQAASAAAYALGPVAGGLLAAAAGFETTLRTAATLNLLYAVYLYARLRAHPISDQWGAMAYAEDDAESEENLPLEDTPFALASLKSIPSESQYTRLD